MTLTRITSDGITDATIATADLADQSVTLAKLPHGTSSNDGKFLRANNGADPTFETVNTDLSADSSPQLGGDLDVNGNNIDLADSTGGSNNRITLGTGDDLSLYHDGSNGYLYNSGSGNLTLVGNGNNRIQIRADVNKNSITCNADGNVELYHDGSKKFETTSYGIDVTGSVHSNGDLLLNDDNQKILIGGGNDLQIYHGSDSNIIDSTGKNFFVLHNSESSITSIANGAVELYHNNSKKCETYSAGLDIVAGQVLRITHANASDGNDGTISSGNFGEGLCFVGTQTVSGNGRKITHYGTLKPSDNNATSLGEASAQYGYLYSIRLMALYDSNSTGLYIGADSDIRGYHDGTNSYFTNKTGNFNIGNTHSSGNVILRTNNTNRWHIDGNGHFLPDANNTYDIGTTSNRVRNIYTNDLNLSNEGGSNDVDGTWGSYTIQEGEESLFLINKRNGKKYKFNLTEVA